MNGTSGVPRNARASLVVLVGLLALLGSLLTGLQAAAAATDDLQAAILPPYCYGVTVVAPVDAANSGSSELTLDLYVDGALDASHAMPPGSDAGFAFDVSGMAAGTTYTLETRSGGVVIDSSIGTVPACSSAISGDVTVAGCSLSGQRPLVQYFINNDGSATAPVTIKVGNLAVGTVDVAAGGAAQGQIEIPAMPIGQGFDTSMVSGGTLVFSGAGEAADCGNLSDTAFGVTRTTCTSLAVNGGLDSSEPATARLEWSNNGPQSVSFSGTGDATSTSWKHSFTNVPELPLGATDVRVTVAADDVVVHNTTVSVGACSAPSPAAGPTVTGQAKVGAKLTCSVAYEGATQTAYAWYIDGKVVPGAFRSTFTTSGAHYLHGVSCASRAANPAGWGALKQSKRLKVSGIGPKIAVVQVPTISGTKRVGRTVKLAGQGKWTIAPTKVTCTWLRNGKTISKATKCSAYKLTTKDRRQLVSVKVTVSRSGYQAGYSFSKKWRVS